MTRTVKNRPIWSHWVGYSLCFAHSHFTQFGIELITTRQTIYWLRQLKADLHKLHLTSAAAANSCISAEIGNYLFIRTAHFYFYSHTCQMQLVWISLKSRLPPSSYTSLLSAKSLIKVSHFTIQLNLNFNGFDRHCV